MDTRPRVYANAAVICDHMIEHKDGSLTLCGVRDTFGMLLPDGVKPAPTEHSPVLVLALTSLDSLPTVRLLIRATSPDGTTRGLDLDFEFRGGQTSFTSILLPLDLSVPGNHLVEVLSAGEVLTRAPLTVLHVTDPSGGGVH